MKVLFGSLTQSFRGGTKFQLDFAGHFRHTEVGFVTTNTHVSYEEKVTPIGPIHVVPPTRKVFKRIAAMRKLAQQYDVLYLNKATLNAVENFTIKHAGFKKVVMHSHSTGKDCNNPIVKLAFNFLHYFSRVGVKKRFDRLFACSRPAGIWLYGKRNQPYFRVINNGIEVEKYRYNPALRKQTKQQLGLSEETKVILHVGAFSPVKNQGYLVDAFACLHQSNPDTVLLLVGDGNLLDDVKQKVCAYGLQEAVQFLGYRDDVFAIMQAADLFVLPSTTEGLPFVAIEAQAAGLPCIISSVATAETKVSDSCTFFDVSQPASVLADSMKEALLQTRFDAADEVISAGFDLQNCVDALERDLQSMFN